MDRFDEYESSNQENGEKPYEIISCKKLVVEFHDCIKEVAEMLEISPTCARLILGLAHWEKNEAVTYFYERDESEILKKLGVPRSSLYPSKPAFQIDEFTELGPKETCSVCLDDVLPVRLGYLPCNHRFCVSCWARFLDARASSDNAHGAVTCIEPKCKQILEDAYIPEVACNPRVASVFQKAFETKFVNSKRNLRYCRGTDCENAAILSSVEDIVHFKCTCGNHQCSGCGKDGHESLPCWLVERWWNKAGKDNDSENMRYLVSNTKPCPKCKNSIEKNGGCNHMTCRSCQTHFCWICCQMFTTDIYAHVNSCTQFSADIKTANLKGKNDLESSWDWAKRFVFHVDRYANHIVSMKNEKKMIETIIPQLMPKIVESGYGASSDKFFETVLETLTDSRRTLSQCYGFLYYVRSCPQQEIFLMNLNDLERQLEDLSSHVEKQVTVENYSVEVRLATINKYRYCRNRRLNLLNHLAEGFEKNWWTFYGER